MTLKQLTLERAYQKAHTHRDGEDVNIFEVLTDYKTVMDFASDKEIDAMADYIADRMGLMNDWVDVSESNGFLSENGWLL